VDGGQPFLTQKLCYLLVREGETVESGHEVERVEALVRSRIINNWEAQDQPTHLTSIRSRLLKGKFSSSGLLSLYQKILQNSVVNADDSEGQAALCLSGLVVRQQDRLLVYNRIYQEVFNLAWVEEYLYHL
jgi:hypothetical protein